jgi:hypothetical protein
VSDRSDERDHAGERPPAHESARAWRPEQAADPDDPRTFERGVLDPVFSNEDGIFEGLRATDEHPRAATGEIDPWAHRRGEPRLFALLWSVYLFGAALTTVMRIPVLGMSEPRFIQEKARMLLLLIAVGLTLLWPMVRLSQARPRKPAIAALVDMFALLAPAQAVIWPLKWLGDWGWDVTAGANLMLASWTLLVGAHVAIGASTPAGLARSVWMALVVLLVCGAPVAAGIAGLAHIATPDELALASPMTGVYAITTAPSGLSASMDASMWVAAALPAVLALPLWLLAPALARANRAGERAPALPSA